MKCRCGTDLQVTHTYKAGGEAETRDLKCPECGMRYTSVAFLVERPSQRPKARGFGATALAKKVLDGELRLNKNPQ